MKSSKKFVEPALINSSYVTLFHLSTIAVALAFSTIFPPELRVQILLVTIFFPMVIFWFSYFVRQFLEISTTMTLILLAIFVVALFSFINAVHGPIADGAVPIIYTRIIFFATLLSGLSGMPGMIYAGTVIVYGAYTYVIATVLAGFLELAYGRAKNIMPKALHSDLKQADATIDRFAIRASDALFVYGQKSGILICTGLIAVFMALYVFLLIS